jgi:poly(3-hydroxybutyrate) depolymerase
MSSPRSVSFLVTCSTATVLAFTGCGTDSSTTGTGGTVGTGGVTTSGGSPGSGGTTQKATGGVAPTTGGVSTGGTSTGGAGGGGSGGKAGPGGASTGGASTGGASTGGSGGGGKATAGSGGLAGAGGSGGATGGQGGGAGKGGGGGASPMTPGKSAGCGTTPTIASSMYNNGQPIPITVGAQQRRFILSVPTNYDNTKPYKLIIAWHQLDGNDKQMYADDYYHLLDLSENSAIFVAPNGETRSNQPCTGTGNGEGGCGWPDNNGRNVDLADAVVGLIQSNFCIDTNRIFATGWSYGGSMSYRTACSRPLGGGTASWGVRGVAVYSGAQLSGMCTPSSPVAYYHSHGTNDTVLGYDQQNNPDGAGVGLAKNFSMANGCTWKTPTKVTNGNHVCSDMVGCMTGYPVKFCSFAGGHTPYPDQGSANNTWQPPVVWEFLNQF